MSSRDRIPWLSEDAYAMFRELSTQKAIRTITNHKVYAISDFDPMTIPCFDEADLATIYKEMRNRKIIPPSSSSASSSMTLADLRSHVLTWLHLRSPHASKYTYNSEIVRQRNAISVSLSELLHMNEYPADRSFDFATYGISSPMALAKYSNSNNNASPVSTSTTSTTSTATSVSKNVSSSPREDDHNLTACRRIPFLRRYRSQCSAMFEFNRVVQITPFKYSTTQSEDGKLVYRANMVKLPKIALAADEVVLLRMFTLPTNCISDYTSMKNSPILDQTLLRTDVKSSVFSADPRDTNVPEILHGLNVSQRIRRLIQYGSLIRRDNDFYVFVNDKSVDSERTDPRKLKALTSNRHKKHLPHLVNAIDVTQHVKASSATAATNETVNIEVACRIMGNKELPRAETSDETDWYGFVMLERCRVRKDEDLIAVVVSRPKLDRIPISPDLIPWDTVAGALAKPTKPDDPSTSTIMNTANESNTTKSSTGTGAEVSANGALIYVRCAVCCAPDVQRCSACKSEWYCSREHQVIHWRCHRLVCLEWKKNGRSSLQVDSSFATQQAAALGVGAVKPEVGITNNAEMGKEELTHEGAVKRIRTEEGKAVGASIVTSVIPVDDDDDLITMDEDSKVTLDCALTYTRMKYPVRGINCKHLQCYDLLSFVTLSEDSLVYCCPYCNKHAPFEELVMSEQLKIAVDSFHESHTHVMSSKKGPYYEVPVVTDKPQVNNRARNTTAAGITMNNSMQPITGTGSGSISGLSSTMQDQGQGQGQYQPQVPVEQRWAANPSPSGNDVIATGTGEEQNQANMTGVNYHQSISNSAVMHMQGNHQARPPIQNTTDNNGGDDFIDLCDD